MVTRMCNQKTLTFTKNFWVPGISVMVEGTIFFPVGSVFKCFPDFSFPLSYVCWISILISGGGAFIYDMQILRRKLHNLIFIQKIVLVVVASVRSIIKQTSQDESTKTAAQEHDEPVERIGIV